MLAFADDLQIWLLYMFNYLDRNNIRYENFPCLH